MQTTDPAFSFFRRFVESEGGLVEDRPDGALVLLPEQIRHAIEAPEELTVTADSDTARETGAALLMSGHPLLDAAVSHVLDAGDVGCTWTAWPASVPETNVLLARAREEFGVEHGRIDLASEPQPSYAPILRIAALLTYGASLDHRFQEVGMACVDARSGLVLDKRNRSAIEAREPLGQPDTEHEMAIPELERAVLGAHEEIKRRAEHRLVSLAAEARDELRGELDRADTYYGAALAALDRRIATASPERRVLLETRAVSMRAERARRFAEIEQKYQPTYDLRPFRLHLIYAPSLRMMLHVRRGERRYSFALTWLLAPAAFAPARCPHCCGGEALVAGRERLGCRACLPRANGSTVSHVPPLIAPPIAPPPTALQATALQATALQATVSPARLPSRANSARSGAGKAPTKAPLRAARTQSRSRVPVGITAAEARTQRVIKEGAKLATRFWQTAALGERWPNKAMEPGSPVRALHRLFGPAAAFIGVGINPGGLLANLSTATAPPCGNLPESTTGILVMDSGRYPYTLRWRLGEARPVVLEVLPFPGAIEDAFPPEGTLARQAIPRLFLQAPQPFTSLTEIASEVYSFVESVGLPLVARCLAAAWRIDEPPNAPAPIVAAALVQVVGARARSGRAKRAVAARSLDLDALEGSANQLRRVLGLARGQAW